MTTTRSDLADLKRRLPVEEYFRQHGSSQDTHGKWRCLCAANHTNGDANPSVTINNNSAKCWSQGCFGTGADIFAVVGVVEQLTGFKNQKRRVQELAGVSANGTPVRRAYRWEDAGGHVAYKIRWDREGKDKCSWALDPEALTLGKGPCQPTVRHLDQVRAAVTVIQVEGEGEDETVNAWLAELGLVDMIATTLPNGAGDVKAKFLQPLHGKVRVYLTGDNDQAGRGYVQTSGMLLQGHVADLRHLIVPEGFKDWTEWKESGATAEDFRLLLDAATCWVPATGTFDPVTAAQRCHEPDEEPVPMDTTPIPDQSLRLTDVGNGELFARHHRAQVRYCYGLKQWYVWDGQRWKPDDGGGMTRLAKQTALSLYERAAQEPEEHRRTAQSKWAMESETERRLNSMMSLARSEPGIAIGADQLDTDLLLLNVQNGTIDLRTGVLRPARRANFITKMASVDYRADATCPIFDGMLNRLFEKKPAMRAYLQRIFGYSLTGLTSEQCFFLFYGTGRNGKTTLLNTILNLLGEYATASRPETFMVKHGDGGVSNDVAALAGVRFVISLESEQGKRLAEGLIKGLSGSDKMKARFLYKEEFTFDTQLKLFIGTNHKPTIKGTDDGIWRKVRCVPFAVQIPEAEKDTHLLAKLATERAGILNWLVAGCLAWQRDGLGDPLEVLAATAAYRAEQDVLGVFLKERCVVESDARSTKKEIYEAYLAWCKESGEQDKHRLALREFGKVLRERGVEDKHYAGDSGWLGIRVRTPLDVEPDDEEPVPTPQKVVADES